MLQIGPDVAADSSTVWKQCQKPALEVSQQNQELGPLLPDLVLAKQRLQGGALPVDTPHLRGPAAGGLVTAADLIHCDHLEAHLRALRLLQITEKTKPTMHQPGGQSGPQHHGAPFILLMVPLLLPIVLAGKTPVRLPESRPSCLLCKWKHNSLQASVPAFVGRSPACLPFLSFHFKMPC